MLKVCMMDQELLAEVSPIGSPEVSHGICRYHYLETNVRDRQADAAELAEYHAARLARRTVVVRAAVPEKVRDLVEAERVRLERSTGRRYEYAEVAGLLLSRAVHREQWERQRRETAARPS